MNDNAPTLLVESPRSHTDHILIAAQDDGVIVSYGNWKPIVGFQGIYCERIAFADCPELSGIYRDGNWNYDEVWLLAADFSRPQRACNPMRLKERGSSGDWFEKLIYHAV